jgi:predicted transcriptional regulator
MIGIDYDSFMIISCIGAHYLRNNTDEGINWDSVWELTRSKQDVQIYNKKKLTIFAVANIMGLPKETVRRKIEALKKKRFITHTTKEGLLPTDKIESAMKPFAEKELVTLGKFLQQLKKHKSLDQLLNLK